MLKPVLPILLALGGAFMAMPAAAQQNDRQLIIYGNDKCPAGTICVRKSEGDRYRIPQTLRGSTLTPQQQPWAARASSVSRADAASGAGSCSPAGAGGWTGCWNRMMRDWRADEKAKAAASGASPAPQP